MGRGRTHPSAARALIIGERWRGYSIWQRVCTISVCALCDITQSATVRRQVRSFASDHMINFSQRSAAMSGHCCQSRLLDAAQRLGIVCRFDHQDAQGVQTPMGTGMVGGMMCFRESTGRDWERSWLFATPATIAAHMPASAPPLPESLAVVFSAAWSHTS